MRHVLFAAAVAAVLSAGAFEFRPVPLDGTPEGVVASDGSVEFVVPPPRVGSRKYDFARYDTTIDLDLRNAAGVSFEMKVSDLWAFTGLTAMLLRYEGRTFAGAYDIRFTVPRKDAWCRIELRKDQVMRFTGEPADWSKLARFRLFVTSRPGLKTTARFAVRDFRVIPPDAGTADVLVVLGDWTIPSRKISTYWLDRSRRFKEAIDRAGYVARYALESELADVPESVRIVVLPYNLALPEAARQAVERHLDRGGRLVVCCAQDHSWLNPLAKRHAERVRDLAWTLADDPDAQAAQFATEFGRLCPELTAAAKGRVRKLAAADAARIRALAHAKGGRPGERRIMTCHDARGGLGGKRNWEESARRLADGGITDLIVDFADGAIASYDSKVLAVQPYVAEKGDQLEACKAACRKYGLKLHAWRCCWTPGGTKEFVDRLEAEGRLQRNVKGETVRGWLCPSNPENHRIHVEAMAELAGKGVDGIFYDFIRYGAPPEQTCFCDHCRAAFERDLGRKVENWPKGVVDDPGLLAEWGEFRCRAISRGVEAIARRVRAEHPNVEISSSGCGDGTNYRIGLARDWLRWAREGWIDSVFLMDYAYDRDALAETLAHQSKVDCGKCVLYPGLGPSCWPSRLRPVKFAERMAEDIAAVRAYGFRGFGIFQYASEADGYLPILRTGVLAK